MKRLKRIFFSNKKVKSDSPSPPDSPDLSKIDPPLRLNLDESPKDDFYRVDVTLLPCAVCNRTFAPESLAKHVGICLKTATNKRKQFDSSTQRLKGTELHGYLPPKNFAISETSLYSERDRSKTPPASTRMASSKTKVQNLATHSRLLAAAESSPCHHCGRTFGNRAIERHVAWCAEQARLARAPGAQNGTDNNKVARERLMARTSYKAPLGKSKRSMNRDKYSLSRSASEGSGMSENSFDDIHGTRGKSEEFKRLPSINKTPLRSINSNNNVQPRNFKKNELDDSYDPYLAAEQQLRDLMSSASNLTKLNLSLDLKRDSSPYSPNPKPVQSPLMKSKDDNVFNKNNNNNINSLYFQRSKSLRSPSKSRYTPEATRKTSISPPKYSLNTILQSNKSQNTESKNYKTPQYNKFSRQNSIQKHDYSPKNSISNDNKHAVKLEPVYKVKKDDNFNNFVSNDSNANNDLYESQESFIDPRIINKDQPLPISVQKFLDNPDLLSSEESLLRENLSSKYGSYADYVKSKDKDRDSKSKSPVRTIDANKRQPTTPVIDDLSAQYDKIMISLEQSMSSNFSTQDEDSLYNDLEELMSSMDGEMSPISSIYPAKDKQSNVFAKVPLDGLNLKNNEEKNDQIKHSSPPFNKSISLNFSPVVSKSSSKTITPTYSRSKSLFDSSSPINKPNSMEKSVESQLEEDIKQSLQDLNNLCENNLSDSDGGGFFSLKRREKYLNENHFYTQDADISKFLPKNLGLSDESPFLENNSFANKNNPKINKSNTAQDIRDKLLEAAKNVCCPSCGHNFDIRAWYAEQIRLVKESSATPDREIKSHNDRRYLSTGLPSDYSGSSDSGVYERS